MTKLAVGLVLLALCALAIVAVPTSNDDSVECAVCKALIGYLAQFAGQDESKIEAEANKFCADLGPLASMCKSVVDSFINEIVQYLNNGDDQEVICEKIGLCS